MPKAAIKSYAVPSVAEQGTPFVADLATADHAFLVPHHGLGHSAILNFARIYDSGPADRIAWIRTGIPAAAAKSLFDHINMPSGELMKGLRLSPATLSRKAGQDANLSAEDSERVIGMAKLIGQVQVMVEESGDPTGFDAAQWTASWLQEPVPALNGARPIDYMDTMEGQGMVAGLLAQAQSGAYA